LLKKIAKGPLFITTALFLATPICMAEVASASSGSSFVQPGSQQLQQQTAINTLKQSLPRTSQGLRLLPFSSIPSLGDINTLESTLSNLEAQLKTLKSQKPEVKPERLTQIESKITTLKATISDSKEAYSTYLKASETLKKALSNQTTAQASYELAVVAEATAGTFLTSKQDALLALEVVKASKTTSLANLQVLLNNSKLAADIADASLTEQKQVKANAEAALAIRQEQYVIASAKLSSAQQTFNEASSEMQLASQQLNSYNQILNQKQQSLGQAQSNYDTNLIPDPTWTAPTYQQEHIRLVPKTETVYTTTLVPRTETVFQEQVIDNLIFNSDFSRGNEGWGGLSIGWQNSQPGYFNGNIVFSYQNQTVSQGLYSGPFNNATLTLSADWFNDESNRNFTDSYSMTVTAKDIDQNPVGSATYTSAGRHDWETKSVVLNPTGPVSYITVSFSGIDNGYWAGNYGPRLKNPTLKITHGSYVTQTTYDEVITSEEVTTYTEEIYYTTELVQPQTGLTVRVYNQLPTSNPLRSDTAYNLCKTTALTSINHQWGGGDILGCGSDRVMIHYTGYLTPDKDITSLQNSADDGFFMSLDGTTVINDWRLKGCGGGWYPVSLKSGQTYAIDAWFYEWGGGACSILNYQSNNGSGVVPEAWYTNAISAPLIKDPNLKVILDSAQVEYDEALTNTQVSQANYDAKVLANSTTNDEVIAAEGDLNNSSTNKLAAEAELTTQVTELNRLTTSNEAAQSELTTASNNAAVGTEELTTAANNVTTASSEVAAAELEVSRTTNKKSAAATSLEDSSSEVTAAQEIETKTSSAASALNLEATTRATETQKDLSTASSDTVPEPEPIPEEGSKEIPAELTAENLLEVNLEAVDPTELTEAQAEQLVEAALETFLTAEEGSPEYEQALDALYLAAEQDDIELSPELAAIPGLAAAAELINFLGNAGADMSPKVREESKKIIVTAVVAAGVAVQAAAGAATSAAASSGGSSGSRRTGK